MTIILLQYGCLFFSRTVFFLRGKKMVRGCQKKIIYLKNTGSEVFDEAYFVVNDKTLGKDIAECDMVLEANRILDECVFIEDKTSVPSKILVFVKRKITPVLIGVVLGVITTLIIK